MALPLIMSPNTPDKLEVASVASQLGIATDVAFARVFRFWAMVHESKDGILVGITKANIDRTIGLSGFCDALIKVGWLSAGLDGVLFVPGFDRYLSEQAVRNQLRELGVRPKEAAVEIPRELQTPAFLEAWRKWRMYRTEIKKKLTASTANKQLNLLGEWGPDKAVAAIERSILHGWHGLFEPKDFVQAKPVPQQAEMERQRQQTQREKAERVPPPPAFRRANRG